MTTQAEQLEHYKGLDQGTVPGAFQFTANRVPDRAALKTLDGSVELTWGEYNAAVRKTAAGLAALGLKKGDTIAIMLVNRPEFHIVDSAAMHLGATPFSIYNTYTADQIAFLVEDAAPKVAVTEQQFLDRIVDARGRDNALEHVVVVDGDGPERGLTLEELQDKGADDFDFDAAWQAVEPDDILTLIYTSGTTGNPKGVQITHRNILETVRSYGQIIEFPDGGRIVSYLPMAHVAERNVSQYLPMLCGFSITCCPDARKVIEYLPEVKPSWFFAVPRIWEKLKAGLEQMMAALPDEQRGPMEKALEASLEKVRLEQSDEEVPEELAERMAQ